MSAGQFFFNFFQIYCLTVVAECQTLKIRNDVFGKIIRMPVSWFDDKKNSPGVLSSKLDTDGHAVNGLTSESLAVIL